MLKTSSQERVFVGSWVYAVLFTASSNRIATFVINFFPKYSIKLTILDGCTLIQNLHLSCLVIQNSMSICLKIAMFVTKDKIKFFLPHHSKRATRLWQRVEYSFLRELFLDLGLQKLLIILHLNFKFTFAYQLKA